MSQSSLVPAIPLLTSVTPYLGLGVKGLELRVYGLGVGVGVEGVLESSFFPSDSASTSATPYLIHAGCVAK